MKAVFAGPAEAVERLVAFAAKGPRRAIVARVEVGDEEPQALRGFDVR